MFGFTLNYEQALQWPSEILETTDSTGNILKEKIENGNSRIIKENNTITEGLETPYWKDSAEPHLWISDTHIRSETPALVY